MLVGTGDCHGILSFYNRCGFKESHRIKNFFIDNYDHPMFEEGKQLVDMVYLKRER
jgi:ribosomal protein S18 acetylase RimI-like enzyme